ncbi:MAG TPA: tetratricopeptide repeat protein, partial [Verrucomicrobiae bacterium]|nr:tetratricopeptide repeat protein [Verrucomicrobiae bacterium]
ALLFGISLLAFLTGRRIPYFAAGWFWYLGMLVPVIGLIQVGSQPHADRYTYLPHIGLCLFLVWGIKDWTVSWPNRSWILGAAGATAIGCLMLGAWRQTSTWRDSESLWAHALVCTSGNFTAHDYLGAALAAKGRTAEAIEEYRKALEINPEFVDAHNDLAEALFKEGRFDEAAEHYYRALQMNPRLAEAQNHLGILLSQKGQTAEATVHFQKAVDLIPDYFEAENNLGTALAAQGQSAKAMQHFQNVLKISPGHAQAHYNLANLLAAAGRLDEAIDHYGRAVILMSSSTHVHYHFGVALQSRGRFGPAIAQFEQVLALDPRHAPAQNNLAWLLATCPDPSLRDGRRALEMARQPEQLSGGKSPEILDTLAAAYAEAGDFQKAAETAKRALSLISNQKNSPLADALDMRLKLYEANTAYHERP